MTNEEIKAAVKECLNELAAEKVSNGEGLTFDSLSKDEQERVREAIINEFLEKGYENVKDWGDEQIKAVNASCHSSSYYRKFINKLDLDFKVKEKLQKIKDFTIKIGKSVLKIGLLILESIQKLASQLPNTVSGLLVGLFMGLIISCIPVIGHALSPIIIPILVILGIAEGFLTDMQQNSFLSKVRGATAN